MAVLRRVREWVRGDEFPVVATAIAMAIPSAALVREVLGADFSFEFLLLLTIGVGVPRLYDRWPRTYDRRAAVAWALGACVVIGVEMSALYVALSPVLGDFWAAVVAFVVADLGTLFLVTLAAGGATPN